MKTTTIKIFAVLILGTLMACEDLVDGDGDININPNNPTSTSYQSVLTTAGVGQILVQNGINARLAGIFAGTYTGIDRQYGGYNTYTIITSDFDGLWDDLFINAYRNAKLTRELAEEQGITGVTIGIAQALEALSLGTAASLYGDIPFDDLGQVAIQNPDFENQVAVYDKIQTLLDDAIINLSSGTGRPAGGSEIFFDGDPAAWLGVANTLKARFYMHTKEYGLAYAAAQNGISASANSMLAPYGEAIEASNLNWQLFANETQGDDIVASDLITGLTAPSSASYRGNAKTNETARDNFLFAATPNGIQPNTADDAFAGAQTPGAIVTYQENVLILAEAGARSVDFATGLGHLNDFRTFMSTGGYLINPTLTDVQYDAYVTADFDAGGMENADNINSDDALRREILEERYVTLFGQIEVFNDTRRTSSEASVRVPVVPNSGSDLPERFLYPQSEIDRNINTPDDPLPGLFEPTQVNQ